MKLFLYLIILAGLASCRNNQSSDEKLPEETPVISFSVKSRFNHNVHAFTEGLLFHKGDLYESTGSPDEFPESESIIGIVDLKTGSINQKVKLDRSIYFGEGIVFLNNKLFQLTYKNQICFVYDAGNFKKLGQYNFSNKEGWGLTTDSTSIIMSDGTNELTYIKPDNFQVLKKVSVSENGYAVPYLNELEYINGYIYANVWTKNEIVKIDPANGNVIGKLDLTSLKQEALSINNQAQETNGIAYNPVTKSIFVTGKFWPKIYELETGDHK